MPEYQSSRRTDNGGITTGWTAVCKDSKSRPKETSQGAKGGTPLGLPHGFLGEETEKTHGSH
jgi:hypothetical protein